MAGGDLVFEEDLVGSLLSSTDSALRLHHVLPRPRDPTLWFCSAPAQELEEYRERAEVLTAAGLEDSDLVPTEPPVT